MKTQITEIKIIPIDPNRSLVAIASCVVDDKIYLGSIGIHTMRKGGFRVTYPTKTRGASAINIWHPIDKEAGDAIEEAVIREYQKVIS